MEMFLSFSHFKTNFKPYLFGHPVCQMLRMGALRQASRGKVYPFGHPACQMLRMGALRQASRDKV